jgi:hypothetical protein
MRFQLLTLIDITETKARKGDNPFEYMQQQNFLTCVQTISLRANPTIPQSSSVTTENLKNFKFGELYKGRHRVWSLTFEFEYDNHSIELLTKDFDLVPVINNLNESIQMNVSAFLTNGREDRNTYIISV